MSASYWIARYIEDPFRMEPRNVGVVVLNNGEMAAKFVGENDGGSLDGRITRSRFAYPDVYAQWHRYWRGCVDRIDIEGLTKVSTNFAIEEAGAVDDTGEDSAAAVCGFLFSMLVGTGGIAEAYGLLDPAEAEEIELQTKIRTSFEALGVLGIAGDLLTPHPVRVGYPVRGQSLTHEPSFSQQNGKLFVVEYIDLASPHFNKAKERAGWMGYMFSDIRSADPGVVAYSIVRPPIEQPSGAIEYAESLLEHESQLVNWADEQQRAAFLDERKRVAVG